MKKIFATSVFAMAALSANAAPLVTIGDQLDIFFRGAVTGSWNSNVTYTGSSNKINDYAAIFRLGAEADYGRNSKFKANVKFFEDLTRYAQHKEFNSNLSHVMATASYTEQVLKIDANFSFDQRFQNSSTTFEVENIEETGTKYEVEGKYGDMVKLYITEHEVEGGEKSGKQYFIPENEKGC